MIKLGKDKQSSMEATPAASVQAKLRRNFAGPWRKTPGRLLGVGLIRLYQLTLSGFVGGHCRHLPTCSEYGYEAIARYGLWTGGLMSFFRLLRCGPFGTSGFDPVPQHLPDNISLLTPWRLWRPSKATAPALPACGCGAHKRLKEARRPAKMGDSADKIK